MAVVPTFPMCFKAFTGHEPLRWQTRLFERMQSGSIPSVCDLPTGLGKTSVIPIWLIAVAMQSADKERLPRRLAYIVNRRTVVDQATSIVEQMRERLRNPEHEAWCDHKVVLSSLATQLGSMAAGANEEPFGVSTLRGELADNEEWKADAARPAIIVGTIDMIGSKLLFSGYGDGRYGRAHHAGLIGQDTLIVHDEAHLTPAFSELLCGVLKEQNRTHEPRCVRIMELSATQRGTNEDALQLEAEDESDEQTGQIVKQRLDATKWLHLHRSDDVVADLVEQAKAHIATPSKVLIYVRSPAEAQKVAAAIRKELGDGAEDRVALLTGTIRGHERDQLLRHAAFKCMLHQACAMRSHYLVSTSAGEVGIDIDADHMACDLTTLDSLIQRFGRVNRRGGETREARVDVVWTEKDQKGGDKPLEEAIAATLGVLQQRVEANAGAGGSHPHPHPALLVTPRRLRELVEGLSEEERQTAISPEGEIPPLTDILLDGWSLTSIDSMPGRPEVAAYLHGLTADPPQTYIAWRKEVRVLADAEAEDVILRDWFAACRIEARERLRDITDRVRTKLGALIAAHRKGDPNTDYPVVLLDERARADWSTLSVVGRKPDRNARDVLRYRTVVLPVEAGGLDEYGMLTADLKPEKGAKPINRIDVAEAGAERRERWLHIRSDVGERFERLLTGETANELPQSLRERERITLKERLEGAVDESEVELVLLTTPADVAVENPDKARFRQTLADHTEQIADHADRIAKALNLSDGLRDALLSAARWHDRGKDRPLWQRFARNDSDDDPLAKSTRYLHGRALGGYRHEFGSLLEAMADEGIDKHPERDLILHLIAAHHGWARPHFEPRAFDHEGPRIGANGERHPPMIRDNEAALVEALQRFGRLQKRFGRWGLAWWESLLRCADIAASKQAVVATDAPVSPGEAVPEEVGA